MNKEEITKEILSILGNFKLSENIQIKELTSLYMKQELELEKLNNIINELEEYSKVRYYEEKKLEHYSSLNAYKDIWNKIMELKGSDKE